LDFFECRRSFRPDANRKPIGNGLPYEDIIAERRLMSRSSWTDAAAERAYPRVYRALIAMGASPADAGDALQDAFERALKHATTHEEVIERPEAWLFVVAARRWRTQRWRSRLFVPLDLLRTQLTVPAPGENAALLITELKRLPRREREVIASRYILGLSQLETAEALGIAVGTVAATTVHATRKLRERIDEANERSRSEAPTVR
jgi:RNA polymerase sigma factor (sigma-70 family)